jgi:DNA-binding GntR family transcriptional regulator
MSMGAPNPPLTRVTMAEQTAAVLRDRIISGELPPGARLIETQLAGELEISRTPIRQALQRLESDGLVVRQGPGLVVGPFDAQVADETLLIRELLEPFAATESAPRLTEPELARLRSILREMEELLETDEPAPARRAQLNMEFHRLLNSRCPYKRIIEVIQVARDAPSAVRLYANYAGDDLRRVHAEHIAIVDATIAAARGDGKSEVVGDLIRDHMRAARAALPRNISASDGAEATA